ncbi:hypothetical protein TNCV_3367021 [Trichonephila clavipes]|nr:hypothetical protein TNCV_3367021 [Trichonephila clavipes]
MHNILCNFLLQLYFRKAALATLVALVNEILAWDQKYLVKLWKFLKSLRIPIIIPTPRHPVLNFGASTPAGSISEGQEHYVLLALSGKVTGVSKIQFQFLVLHPEKLQESPIPTPKNLRYAPAMVCEKYVRLTLFDIVMELS